ncbi:MAG: serine/threonine-protein kinase [Geothrix sp.]|nr:serine/threonine-protein kinase [Geothrix sp.]
MVGSGGEGRVYKAWDNLLERWVALKFPRWDRVQQGRLQEEARHLGRIKHPAIRPIHDLGFLEGQPFLAMHWVEGGTLQKLKDTLDLATKVRLLAEVSEGIAAVHQEGLVHLDLKPANILLERGPEGEWRALVADFGLGLRSGQGMRPRGLGTLPFASPEQLRSDAEVDGRSDVYSLGVMLFMLLTNRPPEEASVPAGPDIPKDLLFIAQKAMAGAPAARYASAASLGQDLRRFLAHEPLSVRRHTPLYLSRLLTRRHPTTAIVAAVAAVILGGLAFRSWQDRRRSAMATRYGQELQEVVSLVNLSHMAPLHDRRSELAQTRARMADLNASIRSLGPAAEGPGNLALGKAHLLLFEYDAALEAFERAERTGLQSIELDEGLGAIRALRYFLNPSPSPGMSDESRKIQALVALRRVAVARPGDASVGVLLALLEVRTEEAYRIGYNALTVPPEPWRHWTLKLLCEIWDGQVQRHLEAEDFGQAGRAVDIFERTLGMALDISRSDPALYESKGLLGFAKAHLAEQGGGSPESALQASLEAFRILDQIQPEGRALRFLAETQRRLGVWRASCGQDPEPCWSTAEAHLAAYGRQTTPWAGWAIGTAVRIHLNRAGHAMAQGKDPRPDLMRCEPWLIRLAETGENPAFTQGLRFYAHALSARAALQRGEPAESELTAMVALARAGYRANLPTEKAEMAAFHPLEPRMKVAERRIYDDLVEQLNHRPAARGPVVP